MGLGERGSEWVRGQFDNARPKSGCRTEEGNCRLCTKMEISKFEQLSAFFLLTFLRQTFWKNHVQCNFKVLDYKQFS